MITLPSHHFEYMIHSISNVWDDLLVINLTLDLEHSLSQKLLGFHKCIGMQIDEVVFQDEPLLALEIQLFGLDLRMLFCVLRM